jgi:adenylate cyclase
MSPFPGFFPISLRFSEIRRFTKAVFFTSALLCVTGLHAGNTVIDSLRYIVQSSKEDTVRVNMLIELSIKYRTISPDTSIDYAQQAENLAQKIHFQKGIGYALKSKGMMYFQQGDYIQALQAWKEGLRIFSANGIKVGEANLLSNIGTIYFNKSLEDSAQDYFLRSLKVSEEISDSFRIASALINLGAIYSNKPSAYDKALEIFKRALVYIIASRDLDLLGTNYSNIGEIYMNRAMKKDTAITARKADLDSALFYLFKAKEVGNESAMYAFALSTIGKVYRYKGAYDTAIFYHNAAIENAKMMDTKYDMAQAIAELAETYKAKSDHKSAIPYYKKAEEIFEEIGAEASYDLELVFKGLTESFSAMGDFVNAYKYQTKLLEVKDKIYNLEVDKKLGTKLFTYEIGKKQGEIDLQQETIRRQKLIRNGFILGFIIVLAFTLVFFAQRNRIAKERDKSEALLLNILPAEVAKELKERGEAKARNYNEVTVMFTDFKDFTKISELLSPEKLVAEINYCFSEFDRIIKKYGIEKIKTIGDAYMCAGGVPDSNPAHASEIIKAGIEIRDFMKVYKSSRQEQGSPAFEIRIGIHTGPVVAGIVGINKFSYDIWGDTVNIAARLESSGEAGRINISGTTYALIKEQFVCDYRGKVHAKNKGEIDMYFVN